MGQRVIKIYKSKGKQKRKKKSLMKIGVVFDTNQLEKKINFYRPETDVS